jgi:cold shock CspA family protein
MTITFDKEKRYMGKVVKVANDPTQTTRQGFGFIVTKEIPFTRIFFHWTGLKQDTIHFSEVKKGDDVEFNVIEYFDKVTNEDRGLRAIHIDVLEPEKLPAGVVEDRRKGDR